MTRRPLAAFAAALVALSFATPVFATPRETTVRTIQDTDGDDLLEYAIGEDYLVLGSDGEDSDDQDFRPPRNRSILNFLQLSDFQMVDEESPARVEFLDWTQRFPQFRPFSAAYRPQESLTTQVTEATVRAARNTTSPVTGERLDLTILTGDNADSQQFNETRWFIDILDGTAGRRDAEALPEDEELPEDFDVPDDFVLADKIDPNSGIPVPGCEATPGSIYDGVRGGGVQNAPDAGYYEPDGSGGNTDGDGYSPNPAQNAQETGQHVRVRDFPGLFERANEPFEAIGLDMEWYSAFGNHDALIQGNSTDAYVGPGSHYGLFVGTDTESWNPQYQMIATGCVKPMLPPGTKLPSDPKELEKLASSLVEDPDEFTQPEVVPPDERRCFVAKDEADPLLTPPASPCRFGGWIQQHFLTTGTPVGHGFAPAACEVETFPFPSHQAGCAGYGRPAVADVNDDGYYSFTPRPGLRFVVLDTITDDCAPTNPLCSEGSVDDPQFRWLEAQIKKADVMGEYAMVFSHHTLRTTRWPSSDASEEPMHYGQLVDPRNAFNPQNPSGEKTLAQLYCENPNVIGHVAGHEHENYVQHYSCDGTRQSGLAGGPSAAVGGFWHISTAAHIDWPQQARMIEFVDNGDATAAGDPGMSLVLTILDHAGPPRPGGPTDLTGNKGQAGEQVLRLASIAREITYNDYQADRSARGDPAFNSCRQGDTTCPDKSPDRNVIIVLKRPWPYP